MKINYYPSFHDSNEEELYKRISEYSGLDVKVTKDNYSIITIETQKKITNEEFKNLDMSMISFGYRRID